MDIWLKSITKDDDYTMFAALGYLFLSASNTLNLSSEAGLKVWTKTAVL